MEFCAEICLEVIIGYAVLKASYLGVFRGFMECHLRLRGFDSKSGIPGPPIWTVEARAERMGVSEGCVDDPIIGQTENEFVRADPRKQAVLSQKAVVSSVI
jgi:hypothetical protein